MIAIIDYGMGNLRSVQKAIEKAGAQAKITRDSRVLRQADKIVLPGVGAMQPAMDSLRELDLIAPVKDAIEEGKPFLGICLGFQLLFESSDEGMSMEPDASGRQARRTVKGMGILKGGVKRFTLLKVPHMGWNQLNRRGRDCPLFRGMDSGVNVYFCHSYYVVPGQENITASITRYGIDFVSSVCKDNIFGFQFHPEKSQEAGLKLLKNFTAL